MAILDSTPGIKFNLLKIYTTSNEEHLRNFDRLQHWIEKHQIKQAMTVVDVNRLFDTLQVELEATLVK